MCCPQIRDALKLGLLAIAAVIADPNSLPCGTYARSAGRACRHLPSVA
jgi:hypothetical protein